MLTAIVTNRRLRIAVVAVSIITLRFGHLPLNYLLSSTASKYEALPLPIALGLAFAIRYFVFAPPPGHRDD